MYVLLISVCTHWWALLNSAHSLWQACAEAPTHNLIKLCHGLTPASN